MMKEKDVLLKLSLLFFSVMMIAAGVHAKTKTVVKSMTKEKFFEAFETAFPRELCKETQFFRQCFQVSEEECFKESLRTTKVCIFSLEKEVPSIFTTAEEARQWGSKLGSCSGRNYEISLLSKKKKTADCNDISKWQPKEK